MKIRGMIAKVYPKQCGESLHGTWQYVDAVVRNDEVVTHVDGGKSKVTELIAFRVRGELVDRFVSEVKAGDVLELTLRPECEERISKSGNLYVCNAATFSCPEWR